ncbi:MAG TPA: GTP-binding protein [Victivallales bacterium]|nr:GTP-binding protein [Victivallales bacterium]
MESFGTEIIRITAMDIIIISGFLGSGKTTVLLSIAKDLVEKSKKKIAIIENEVGKIGVDDQTIKAEGLAVREIFSGCICCTLKLSLVNTLMELENSINPDIVIIEPSGVAGPHLLLEGLLGYGGEIDRRLVINIVDASRSSLIFNKPLLPIVERGIEVADIILVNKVDSVQPEVEDSVETGIREIKPEAKILFISALTGYGMESIADEFEELLSKPKEKKLSRPPEQSATSNPDATVFAEKFYMTFDPPIDEDEAKNKIPQILQSVSEDLKKKGCKMIGHIKAIFKDKEDSGYMLISITDFNTNATVKNRIRNPVKKASLTINAIVYGIDPLSLSLCIKKYVSTIGKLNT